MLSLRLSTLKHFYHQQHSVWDIGCDHARLGLSFLSIKQVSEIHLVDPSLNVVNVLKQTIKDSDIPEHALIKIHHKKGQEITLNPMSKLIFLAGMGGEEIQEILQHIGPQLGLCDTVVISPHRKILELRAWLSASHYRLLDERVIYENGQFYQVIALKQNSDLPQVSSYGISLWQNEVGRTYRLHMIRSFSCHVDLKSRQFVEYLKCLSC